MAKEIEAIAGQFKPTRNGGRWEEEIIRIQFLGTEIVRCKECRYYLNSNEECEILNTRLNFFEAHKYWTEDSYCSWGERIEDGR